MQKLAQHCQLHVQSISTKRVNFAEKKNVNKPLYNINRIVRELLSLPARWLNKGQDMHVTLQKPIQ